MLKALGFDEVDPGTEISDLLACHAPVTPATEPLAISVPGNIAQVVHASVSADCRIAASGQRTTDHRVCRKVEVRPPTVDPNDRNRFGRVLGRKQRTSIHDVI